MVKPIFELDFWRRRLNAAHAEGRPVHAAIFDVSAETWAKVQADTKKVLPQYLKAGEKILDAGCACGHLLDVLPEGVLYKGIDLSPDFVDIARKRHPRAEFEVGDLADLPYKDNAFDWAVVRAVDGMVKENAGSGAWERMEKELLRVAPRLLLFGYEDTLKHVEVKRR